jgi:DNA adenine methylase
MDARFNRSTLCRKIRRIADSSTRIEFNSVDAESFLAGLGDREDRERLFVYLDPPYYHQGQYLYMNAYDHAGHESLAKTVKALEVPWLMSYDNCDEVRELYADCAIAEEDLYYSAQTRRIATEVIISPTGAGALRQTA